MEAAGDHFILGVASISVGLLYKQCELLQGGCILQEEIVLL